jgi:hypothetical protein
LRRMTLCLGIGAFGTAPNSTHGLPLALPSCNPPVQTSDYLTLVAPDRPAPFNQPPDGRGQVTLKVSCLTPGTTTETGDMPHCEAEGDQVDVKITLASSGVRCTGAPSQGNCTGGAGSLYTGKVMSAFTVRTSDHYNTAGAPCDATTSCAATMVDIPFDFGAKCSAGACNYVTSADLTIPGFAIELKRTVLELREATVEDAGINGDLVSAGAPHVGGGPPACLHDDAPKVFMKQGLFAP